MGRVMNDVSDSRDTEWHTDGQIGILLSSFAPWKLISYISYFLWMAGICLVLRSDQPLPSHTYLILTSQQFSWSCHTCSMAQHYVVRLLVGLSVARFVGWSVGFPKKRGKLHFHSIAYSLLNSSFTNLNKKFFLRYFVAEYFEYTLLCSNQS